MKFAISAGHDATADAAAEILHAGGNAFDAAIAAFLTSFVAEPCMSSAGGGAFANVFTADGKSMLFDFFCQTPQKRKPAKEVHFFPVEIDFGTAKEIFHIGNGSTGVPGSIAGIFEIHRKLATMPMRELAQPAIQAASEGLAINDFQFLDLNLLQEIFLQEKRGQTLFLKNGNLLQVGDILKMPQLADFLDYLWREGAAAFYKGEVARKIVAHHQEHGGFLTREDLESYQVEVRPALHFDYFSASGKKTILTNPLPSTGGAAMALAFAFLNQKDLPKVPFGKKHLEIIHQVFEKTDRIQKTPTELAQALFENYDFKNLKNISPKYFPSKSDKRGSTSHFNIVDRWGNAISWTMSIGEGCGHFVEGTDIHLNNMLGEAALLPGGFHSWATDVRLSSMMSPTIVLDALGKPEIVLGSGGASRIPTVIAQVLHYLLDYDLDLEKAVNAPRVHLEHGVFNVEPGFDFDEINISQKLKKWNAPSLFFGGVHTLKKSRDAWQATGDDRRDGIFRME